MASDDREVILNGHALRAVVRAAETPLVGIGVKKRLFSQLGLDELFELDLREYMNPETILSAKPARHEEESADE
ncbi:MAG: hypothetical protein ACQEVA_17830 [Myxococcota bacterium]